MAKRDTGDKPTDTGGAAPLPSKADILDFIRDTPGTVGKREIARAFNIKGAQRAELNALLKELRQEGLIGKPRGKRFTEAGRLPEVTVLEVVDTTVDGDVLAAPTRWDGEEPPPRIYLRPDRRFAPGKGDRVLARLHKLPEGDYEARTMKKVGAGPSRIIGLLEKGAGVFQVRSVDRRQRHNVTVATGDAMGAKLGDLVEVEVLPGKPMGPRRGQVVERLGGFDEPQAISLIAIHQHEIPVEFSRAAVKEAEAAKPVSPKGRVDLRPIPLVTIDGADARDFDDAVFAEPDDDPKNSGGWHLIVAIADVAHYVRPNGALDKDALERGNSVYFPDRVVPMLPEALSNELCSLKPGVDRACMAAHLWIDKAGQLIRHRFERGIMRSAARLTYEQVQAAKDGRPDDKTGPLLEPVIEPLYGAYGLLDGARRDRQALEIDLPELQVVLDENGKVDRVAPRERLDAHKLIEEFMIAANVAAAETLENRQQPCVYRVHEPPDAAKLEAMRPFLEDLGYSLPKGQVMRPVNFNRILSKAADTPHERMVNELVLRSQTQAYYSPRNAGHFGLALSRYAHFTSPIRRYSDLLVHRLLLGPGKPDGLGPDSFKTLDKASEHISITERRAMTAERDANDRYLAAYLVEREGAILEGSITGVTRFGLFILLKETGASGIVPMRRLSDDHYIHDEDNHALIGEAGGYTYRLGEPVKVRLVDADPVTGGILLDIVEHEQTMPALRPPKGRKKGRGPKKGKKRRRN